MNYWILVLEPRLLSLVLVLKIGNAPLPSNIFSPKKKKKKEPTTNKHVYLLGICDRWEECVWFPVCYLHSSFSSDPKPPPSSNKSLESYIWHFGGNSLKTSFFDSMIHKPQQVHMSPKIFFALTFQRSNARIHKYLK